MARVFETKDLILKRGEKTDAEKMHQNFFCEEESAKYMLWQPTKNAKDAETKLEKWTKYRDYLYFGYLKETNEPIGFVCINQNKTNPLIFDEIGICVGTKFKNKGYAKQMLKAILDYCKTLGATKFEYSFMDGNLASKKLAESFGFEFVYKKKSRKANGEQFIEVFYEQNV